MVDTMLEQEAPEGDVIRELALAAIAARAAARQAKINGAKTNLEQLMAAGVIVTEDDARDNAYRYEYQCKVATALGIRPNEAGQLMRQADAEQDVVLRLLGAIYANETDAEQRARFDAVKATAQGAKENGKPCQHRETKRERAWSGPIFVNGKPGDPIHGADRVDFVCYRCGARVSADAHVHAATPGALAALRTIWKAAEWYRAHGQLAKAVAIEPGLSLAGVYTWASRSPRVLEISRAIITEAWRVEGVTP